MNFEESETSILAKVALPLRRDYYLDGQHIVALNSGTLGIGC
jgi:hypothetical protein